MSLKFVIIFNLILCGLNFYILWKLIEFKKYLFNINTILIKLNYNLFIILKEIPLTILLTALEIEKVKNNYSLWQIKIRNTQKIIIITKFIYQIFQQKFV